MKINGLHTRAAFSVDESDQGWFRAFCEDCNWSGSSCDTEQEATIEGTEHVTHEH